jgi:hypothetical protein
MVVHTTVITTQTTVTTKTEDMSIQIEGKGGGFPESSIWLKGVGFFLGYLDCARLDVGVVVVARESTSGDL